jgi:hypothetical protein
MRHFISATSAVAFGCLFVGVSSVFNNNAMLVSRPGTSSGNSRRRQKRSCHAEDAMYYGRGQQQHEDEVNMYDSEVTLSSPSTASHQGEPCSIEGHLMEAHTQVQMASVRTYNVLVLLGVHTTIMRSGWWFDDLPRLREALTSTVSLFNFPVAFLFS